VWANHQAVYILHMNSVNPSRCFLLVNEALPLYDAHASEVEMSVFNKTMASSDKFSIERVRIYGQVTIVTGAMSVNIYIFHHVDKYTRVVGQHMSSIVLESQDLYWLLSILRIDYLSYGRR
jgi:hypothetical protein